MIIQVLKIVHLYRFPIVNVKMVSFIIELCIYYYYFFFNLEINIFTLNFIGYIDNNLACHGGNLTCTGSCDAAPCSIVNATIVGDNVCSCLDGFKENIIWNTVAQQWDGTCTYVPCPANSNSTTHPDCTCD